jgi:AsmA protein
MKRGAVIGLSIAGGVLALLLISPFLIPVGAIKNQVEKSASESLGREFKINDGMRLTYWPVVGVDAKGVTIANSPGGKAKYFLEAKEIAIGVAVMPLFKGDVQVRKLVATEPRLALEANPGGAPNWVFTPAKPTAEKQDGGQDALKNIGLGDVRVEKGALTFDDGKGSIRELTDIDAKVELPSLDAPLKLDGEITMNKERLKTTLAAVTPRAFANKGKTPISVTLESEVLNATLDGALDTATTEITGALAANGKSLRKLIAWQAEPMKDGPGFNAFDVAGQLTAKDKDILLSNVQIKIDNIQGAGNLKINTTQEILYVAGDLAFKALDLNVYMPAPPAGGARGVSVQAGWPKDPIDLTGLKSINAELALTTEQLLFQRFKIDSTKLNLNLKGGVLNAALNDLRMYGGRGSGTVLIDARQAGRIAVAPKLTISGLQAHPFLVDAINLDKIDGVGTLNLSLTGGGANTDQLMRSLAGAASFNFADGAVRGINLAQISRQVQSALTGQAVGPAAKTDFAEMASAFTIKDGVATTQDFRLINPFIRVTGKGSMDIGQQTFNFRIDPKAVQSGQGQGGSYDLGGVGVPFLMTGPWLKPKFTPDIGDYLKGQATKQLDKLLGVGKTGEDGAEKPNPLGGLLQGLGR